ncbi:UDP-N-acetylmuramoyl-L-alanyl-D-glutamate--2,6-diaminopimelate ligase [Natronoglycomyces albus]|uniref:UDP-N-acetylmuramoyl-L-alanyl-D-glutamate--2,6-diaminopimelate ligase n=1 Tax=Natronoglycomyces albus TaxID=2811108 RepID=A0A895XPQ3_9ACTN|nr:UDP-N-acetylmuramoyl-L-alanyl-D-glutamate--2,6-diaminopimelate ligase [Natronoglycomyces albus]QSB04260.1 UDP-N-acetylmuramoyl-L-alanyl-D-glutamate--2,6-diaminopimelate ligase [Natronoglycomyces albus]
MLDFPRPTNTEPLPLAKLADLLTGATNGGTTVEPDNLAASLGGHATGISLAGHLVQRGDIYAALAGANRHGAEFSAQAIQRGAVAILTDERGAQLAAEDAAEAGIPLLLATNPRALTGEIAARIWGRPSEHLNLIGITGTSGKTSVCYLIEAGLRHAGRTTGIIGTVETTIAGETIPSKRTTPEAPELQALLAVALERGVTDVVMEVSSHALTLGRVGGCRFAVAGYTMFGTDHLDFHRDLDEYFQAKAELFDGRATVEILNADDERVISLAKPETVTYSLTDPRATWYAASTAREGFDQHFFVTGPEGTTEATLHMPGRHNMANALLAYASLSAVGVPLDTATSGVASCPGVPGRMELVSGTAPVRGVVDYAHKPEAISAVLDSLQETTPGRVIAILGAGGDRDASKRALMGRAAAASADLVMITDDNPRTEDPASIRAQVASAVQAVPCRNISGREVAVREAVAMAAPGDTIALLGKGHETTQELADRVIECDDRVLLARALADAGWVTPAAV